MTVSGAGSDGNAITVAPDGTDLKVTDTGFGTSVSGDAACPGGACPAAMVTSIVVNGGDGFDSLTVDAAITLPATLNGGNHNDTMVGGAGGDTLNGGEG